MNKITNQSSIQEGNESGLKKCFIHKEQEYAGICLNKECNNERILVCYECIYQMHCEHSQDVLIFKLLEQKQQDQLLKLFQNKDVLQVYEKIEDYRDKYANDILIEDKRMLDIKNKYKQQFQQTINKLHQMVNQQIDDIYDQHNNKCLYLLDQMFQKHYPLQKILFDFKQLKNTNKVQKQIQDLENKIKSILINQEQYNDQILNLNKVDEGQKIEKYLDRLLESVESNLYQQSIELLKSTKFIDCSQKHGFLPLMKLVKDDMHYNNQLWTTRIENMIFPSSDFNRQSFSDYSNIYEEYYSLNIKQILIETIDDNDNVRYSLLQKTQYRPLVNEFKENKVQTLRLIDGESNPLVLFGGQEMNGVKVLANYWRINSYQCNTKDNFKVRLGCHFVYSNSQFDRDSAGNSCSHEVAGLGITDDYYKNSGNRFRSAGVRQFNNRNTLPNQMGQHYANVNIYGR